MSNTPAFGDRYDPETDPDAVPCPDGCGELTDDPYGGPCTHCWSTLDRRPYDRLSTRGGV